MRPPSPLWLSAALRLPGSGVWGLLVVAAFTVLSAAAASEPLFAEAGRNAAMRSALEAVPPGARAADAPVVRVVGGGGTRRSTDDLAERLRRIPGLTPPHTTAVSVAAELRGRDSGYTFAVEAGGRSVASRVVGIEDPGTHLVAAGASSGAVPAAGVWLPADVASQLGVRPGSLVSLVLRARHLSAATATATVAGTYRTGADGRRPADRPGADYWALLRGALPSDVQFASDTAHLVVADTATARAVSDQTGDELLWLVDAALRADNDTLAGVGRTAAGVEALRAQVVDQDALPSDLSPVSPSVVSGIAIVHGAAQEVADATEHRAGTLSSAAVALGVAAVAAVAVLGLRRRRTEQRLATGLGLRPAFQAALAGIEHLPAAVLGVAAGVPLAYAVIRAVGPPGRIPGTTVHQAAVRGAVTAGAGLVVVVAVALVAALVVVRPSAGTVRRRVPWEALTVVAAATASAGLLTASPEGASSSGLSLLVPLLVTAAVGAVGGRVVTWSTAQLLRRRSATSSGRRASWAGWLALRRLAAPGAERAGVVAVLSSGLGLLLFALCAATSTTATTGDRVAVTSGARATADIEDSSALDPSPPRRPTGRAAQEAVPPAEELAQVHPPPVAPWQTVVWRTRVGIGGSSGNIEVLAVDPDRFAAVASWGTGSELAAARRLMAPLATGDREALRLLAAGQTPVTVPVVAVNYPGMRTGSRVSVQTLATDVPVQVVGTARAFPGLGTMPMLVAPQASMLFQAGPADPRYANGGTSSMAGYFGASLWSSRGAADVDETLQAHHVEPVRTSSELVARQQPQLVAAARGLGYLRTLGLCAGLIALLAFAMHADRSAARARATELMLRRVGLGARGVWAARLLELAAMAAAAVLLAAAGWALVAPMAARLLDPQQGQVVAFDFGLDAGSLAATAGAAVLAVAVAAVVAGARARAEGDEQVLRGAE
ncbi:putative ABC transport system permease protein [Motilibacter peucedani]|uniref:Putative ABC transport system permease protein n=1 Tax=Motilibacter peucedani TaxID=598650 RepID=A0A420XQH2_9ACTN|nr:hypothetical protein [Motilibacter peucedani]RKS75520.1 putative ABC transport system permease protein [Motilibacter peucedani]